MEQIIAVFISCIIAFTIIFIIIISGISLLSIIAEKIYNRMKYGKTDKWYIGCKSVSDFYDDVYDKDEVMDLYPDVPIKDISIINIKLIK